MNNKLLLLILFLSVTTLIDCGKAELSPREYNEFGVPYIIPNGNEKYLNGGSEYIFNQQKLHTFYLNIPLSQLAKINNDPAAEEYVEGSLIFEGDTISPVGIRYKGSIGAFVNCVSGGQWFAPSGHKTCTKLSMKVKVNWEGREDKFYKLNKLQFHSQNLDKSQMRERLGYWLFNQMNVRAPRSVHAKLVINGGYVGLFALTEQIDRRFVKHNFNDDEGNLYKEVWPIDMNGDPQSDYDYKAALKTNEDENPSIDLIKNFAKELAETEVDDGKSVVEKTA